MNTLFLFFKTISNPEFWQNLLASLQAFGPLPAILLAACESFFPALPLTGIVILNVAAYGTFPGYFYTWIGSCAGCTITFLFFRYLNQALIDHLPRYREKTGKARAWISEFDVTALFFLICLPFTPSSFVNFAFGISEYPKKKYLMTLFPAKIIMIGSLSFLGDSLSTALKHPLKLVLSLLLMLVLYIISVYLKKKHNLK